MVMAGFLSLVGAKIATIPAKRRIRAALRAGGHLHRGQGPLRASSVAKRRGARHGCGVTQRKSPLEDPINAAHAWARYRRIMRWLLAATVLTVGLAMGLLFAFNGMISVHFYIAVALGISFTMLLGGGLMGLVFLSHGTGHDESVDNHLPARDEVWLPRQD